MDKTYTLPVVEEWEQEILDDLERDIIKVSDLFKDKEFSFVKEVSNQIKRMMNQLQDIGYKYREEFEKYRWNNLEFTAKPQFDLPLKNLEYQLLFDGQRLDGENCMVLRAVTIKPNRLIQSFTIPRDRLKQLVEEKKI